MDTVLYNDIYIILHIHYMSVAQEIGVRLAGEQMNQEEIYPHTGCILYTHPSVVLTTCN
jgi:hypothetical protein